MSGLQFTWLRKGERTSGSSPLLKVKGLTVRVGIRCVLSAIDLEVYEGDHIRVTGVNGSGKSTLLNAIAGVEPAKVEQGTIVFLGQDITRCPSYERANTGIAYMRQTDNIFPGLSIAENLQMALGQDGTEMFHTSFPEWREVLPLGKSAGALSGGQRKKLAWAMVVLKKCPLTLVDEPEAGVSGRLRANLSTMMIVEHGL